jgi:hypothetical protein
MGNENSGSCQFKDQTVQNINKNSDNIEKQKTEDSSNIKKHIIKLPASSHKPVYIYEKPIDDLPDIRLDPICDCEHENVTSTKIKGDKTYIDKTFSYCERQPECHYWCTNHKKEISYEPGRCNDCMEPLVLKRTQDACYGNYDYPHKSVFSLVAHCHFTLCKHFLPSAYLFDENKKTTKKLPLFYINKKNNDEHQKSQKKDSDENKERTQNNQPDQPKGIKVVDHYYVTAKCGLCFTDNIYIRQKCKRGEVKKDGIVDVIKDNWVINDTDVSQEYV